jgi:phage/plasmid-associated DNA primase
MVDKLIQNPADNAERWRRNREAVDKAFAAQEHQQRLVRIKAACADGTYRDDGPELDASLDKPQAAIDAAKAPETLAESMHKPDLAERERAAFDELNDGDRWDGLS